MAQIDDSKRRASATTVFLFSLIFYVGLLVAVTYFFKIVPTKEYKMWMGAIHGFAAPVSWIGTLFSDSILAKAPLHASGYNITWWVALIFSIRSILQMVFQFLLDFTGVNSGSGKDSAPSGNQEE